MNFLSRKLAPTESAAKIEAQNIVHREIEITVERTWTTVSASAPAAPSDASTVPPPPRKQLL